jgi:hypothetical protein
VGQINHQREEAGQHMHILVSIPKCRLSDQFNKSSVLGLQFNDNLSR